MPVELQGGEQRAEPVEVALPRLRLEERCSRGVGQAVAGADLAVTEPVGGHRELHRHERRLLGLVEAQVGPNGGVSRLLLEHCVNRLLAADARGEVGEHGPLVVAASEALGLGERLVRRRSRPRYVVDEGVVELMNPIWS